MSEILLRRARTSTSAAELATLAGHEDVSIREAVAHNDATAPALLAALAGDATMPVRAAALGNPACPREQVLTALGGDGVELLTAAGNASLTRDDVLDLLRSANPVLRAAAAGNPNLTGPDYVELAADADAGVRAAVAANPGAGTAALEHLSGDADPAIVEIVAGNPNAPLPFLGRRRVGDLAPWRAQEFIRRSLPAGAARDAALARLADAGDDVALDSLLD